MVTINGDAGSGIPQTATEAGLDDRAIRVMATEDGVGLEAVGATQLGGTNDGTAQAGEIAGLGEGGAVGPSDD